jgi:glycerol-3-phosphate dehydrogenase (NAD(P)+)
MFKDITIIGDGAMASVCAMILRQKGLAVKMWGYDPKQLGEIEAKGENIKFLPGYKMPEGVVYQPDDAKAMLSADLILSAVPCQFVRCVWSRLNKYSPDNIPIVSVTKGIDNEKLLTPTEIIREVLNGSREYAALSGPTIADELARRLPASITCASCDIELAQNIQYTFATEWFRVYTNDDIVGVELCGALKNVIAIAAGIIDGTGLGDNAKAALLSRGLAEIKRLGVKMGARDETFSGLSGLGDLVTTCISPKGRNRSFGEAIAKGADPQETLANSNSVIEGAATCKSVISLAKIHNVEMPITQAVHSIIYQNKSVSQAIQDLMTRKLKHE